MQQSEAKERLKGLLDTESYVLSADQYKNQAYPKYQLFLHHPAGSFPGSFHWWQQTKPRVGTAITIDRDGQGYQHFPLECGAWHLGVNRTKVEMESIGIEVTSYGYLHKKGNEFKTEYGQTIDPSEVVEFEYRGFKYWHKYTDAQLKSLEKLIPLICEAFPGIEIQNDMDNWHSYEKSGPVSKGKRGVWGHTTVRQKDKFDLVPYPEVNKLIIKTLKKVRNQQKAKKK